eukprot:TRINITY_DN3754_c0_g2_i2.p1 TRINITY_DN3754_c0_g2~~TRINITY_DN3754_c0_g2_i2.p1  ORF type:complete len:144 (-),score=47.81 TRINITY_DN3754_c0_g2_i2:13-444(-)
MADKKKQKEEEKRKKKEQKEEEKRRKKEEKEAKRNPGAAVKVGKVIGAPTNFQRELHIGFNPETGMFEGIPDSWKAMLGGAGLGAEQIKEDAGMLVNVFKVMKQQEVKTQILLTLLDLFVFTIPSNGNLLIHSKFTPMLLSGL